MYYNRTISDKFSALIEKGGKLRWLFDFVKGRKDLDFLIGRNNSQQWISVYRGLTRILKISPPFNQIICISAAKRYKDMSGSLYGKRNLNSNFQKDIENLITQIENTESFDRYYKNKKEGYYQNEFSRSFGICGGVNDDFVIIDKEDVIGYKTQMEKDDLLGKIQLKYK
jgi:hypothetical protein